MPINVAILGLAHGHVGVYCDVWRKHAEMGINLVGAWDHDAARLAIAKEKWGVAAFATPQAALESNVDAVVIGAETSLHADLVEAAAAAGKKIILQKPLALTMAEADRIVEAVKNRNVPFSLAWQMRIDPQNLEMKHLILSNTLGKIFMVRRRHGLSTHVWPGFENTWHVKPELNRGMWADDASHAIDFLLWLLGEPLSVSAEIATLRSEKVPDDNGIAIFRYADGKFAEVVSSFTCLAGENTTEIVGEEGAIIQNYGDGPSTQVPRPKDAVGLKWFLKGGKEWLRTAPRRRQQVTANASPASRRNWQNSCAANAKRFAPPKKDAHRLRMTLACYRNLSSEEG